MLGRRASRPVSLLPFSGFTMKARAATATKSQAINLMKGIKGKTTCLLAILLCCPSSMGCASRGRHSSNHDLAKDDLSLYRTTNDQAGHELVKTEQFLVPVGSAIVIKGLEFDPGVSTLTRMQERIVQQVFNSLEEITENTVGDTNSTRVAEFKKMEFEIRGYADMSGSGASNAALAETRAKAVLNFLTYLGTPPWRLKATGLRAEDAIPSKAVAETREKHGRVEFIRTR
jgi:outer membrane protein OmpA-like peptidoglycan-associated protein